MKLVDWNKLTLAEKTVLFDGMTKEAKKALAAQVSIARAAAKKKGEPLPMTIAEQLGKKTPVLRLSETAPAATPDVETAQAATTAVAEQVAEVPDEASEMPAGDIADEGPTSETPTSETNPGQSVADVAKKIAEFLAALHGRWTDESEFEDWTEYQKTFRTKIEKLGGTTNGLGRKGRFAVEVTIYGKTIRFKTVRNGISAEFPKS